MGLKRPVYLVLLLGLSGCASLPTGGPTRREVAKTAGAPLSGAPIEVVEVRSIGDVPAAPPNGLTSVPLRGAAGIGASAGALAAGGRAGVSGAGGSGGGMSVGDEPAGSAPGASPVAPQDGLIVAPEPGDATPIAPPEAPVVPTDMLGPGDVLDISIYEAGVALYAGGATSQNALIPGVQVQRLPPIRVDDHGYIALPYTGRLYVQGSTVREVEQLVKASLRGMSQSPHVLISLKEAIANTVIIGGEVARPGRLVLQTNRERLTDVIALAGGYRGNTKDLLVRVIRGEQVIDIRLNDLVDAPSLDMRMAPGDRVMLINEPRSYSVLGASGAVAQIPFSRSSVSVVEAIATAGGVNPNIGDPAAIFLFRYEKDGQGYDVPRIYHLNMMQAGTYFLAQRFVMRDKDVLYFGAAAANQPAKMLQLISQLFTPLMTVTSGVVMVKNAN